MSFTKTTTTATELTDTELDKVTGGVVDPFAASGTYNESGVFGATESGVFGATESSSFGASAANSAGSRFGKRKKAKKTWWNIFSWFR